MLQNNEPKSCVPNFLAILSAPFLIFVVAIVSYLGYLSLKVEVHTLIIIGLIFFIFLFFVKHNANFVACRLQSDIYNLEERVKTFLKQNELEINGKVKSLSNLDNFFEEELRSIKNDNFSSVASTVFPMLGILGTFIAIAISMPNFSVTSTEALDKEISLLLSGVGTAFYASIYGIFLSLWWIYFDKRGVSKIESSITYMKKLYARKIWTRDEIEIYKLSSKSNEDIVKALKETLNIDFIKNLNERYTEDFQLITEKTTNLFSKIAAEMENATTNFENSLKEMYHSENALKATIKIDETLREFTKSTDNLKEVAEKIENGLSSTLENNFEKVDKEIADIVVKLADFGFLLDEQVEKVLIVIEQYHKEILKQSKQQQS